MTVASVLSPVVSVPLTKQDRCDRCSAQAALRVTFDAGELVFCGHHFNRHQQPLSLLTGFVVDDQRPGSAD